MRAGFVAIVMCVTAAHVAASIGPQVSIEARTRGAAGVVIAAVVDVQSRFDINEFGDRLIVSEVTLQVEETLKGAPRGQVAIVVEGGTVGDLTMTVSDMPRLGRGERAVFFLESGAAPGSLRPHRRGLGIVKLDAANRVAGTTLTVGDVRRMVRSAQQ